MLWAPLLFHNKLLFFLFLTTLIQPVIVIKYYLQIFQAFFFGFWKDNILFRSGFANLKAQVNLYRSSGALGVFFRHRRKICEISKIN